ncbi:NmrA family NAD(P)-binding protein [Saccharopolyspora sp. NPDC003752]
MTVLITGGTGKTGRPLATVLRERGIAVRIASRHPADAPDHVRFDWADPDSQRRALDGVDRVYLVPPVGAIDPMPQVGPFLATAAGRRIVALGSSAMMPNAPGLEEYRARIASTPGCAVLLPTWFMQNFTGRHPVADGIRERGEIVTATGSGRLGWIDAADIAAVAAHALTSDEVADEYLLTGPETLSYGEAAAIISEVAGRPVRHRHITTGELARRLSAELPADFAAGLAAMDEHIRAGGEDRTTSTVQEVTGRPPRSFRDFIRAELG